MYLLRPNSNVDFGLTTVKFPYALHRTLAVLAPQPLIIHQSQHRLQVLPLCHLPQRRSITERTRYEESICTCLLFHRPSILDAHRQRRGGWLVLEVCTQIMLNR